MKSQADFPISLSQAYGPVRAIDLALYAAKSAGRNDLAIYDPAKHGEPGPTMRRLA